MYAELSAREKWFAFLQGEEVGPMVSPVCDDWALDQPYAWPGPDPEPFPPGSPYHAASQQLAMAALCGWDACFWAAVPFHTRNADIGYETHRQPGEHGTRVESRISTPYGDLTSVTEEATTTRTLKSWLEDEDDYRKAIWLTQQAMDYDEDTALQEGKLLRAAIGERGVLGTWSSPPLANFCGHDEIFYQMADFPGPFAELHEATTALTLKQLPTLREAGFDFLFYCVSGTEWISPGFFQSYVLENTRRIFEAWRAEGGFILWHTCGHLRLLLEQGAYDELRPEIFETLSEPPVGDLPSLRWARQRLDPAIITKGNIGVEVLLNGTEEQVRGAVHRVREETRGYRHIVALSDDVLHHTPRANCLAFVAAAREP